MSVEWPFTRLGMKFFEGDVPRLVRALEKIGEGLNRPTPLRLSDRETATVLAALRLWQANAEADLSAFRAIATDGDTLRALDDDEIDNLCIKLNTEKK